MGEGSGWPDVTEEHGFARLVVTDRFSFEIDIDVADESVSDDQSRRSQVVSTGERVDSSFEVSVTREDGSSNDVTLLDGSVDFRFEFTSVTNAGHAAVTGGGEAELFQERLDTRFLEVLGDDSRTRTQGGLDVGLDGESLGESVLGEETSGNHGIRVGSVGAGSDGSNNDRSVGKGVVGTLVSESVSLLRLFSSQTESLEASLSSEDLVPFGLHVRKRHSVVGTLGTRDARFN